MARYRAASAPSHFLPVAGRVQLPRHEQLRQALRWILRSLPVTVIRIRVDQPFNRPGRWRTTWSALGLGLLLLSPAEDVSGRRCRFGKFCPRLVLWIGFPTSRRSESGESRSRCSGGANADLVLALPDGSTVIVSKKLEQRIGSMAVIWHGSIAGMSFSRVTFSTVEHTVVGTIAFDGKMFRLRSVSGAVVELIDMNSLPQDNSGAVEYRPDVPTPPATPSTICEGRPESD